MPSDSAYLIFPLLACLAGAVLLPVISGLMRGLRRLREEQEAQFLREYPELAELVAQDQRR